ncbi:hypothetical protein BGZ75_004594 [Mortierella antarctica]|nr:hypothetical protein BGZ75_004594 [Mortierella antarctica]
MSSRTPSIYCDALETPPREPMDEGPSTDSSSLSQLTHSQHTTAAAVLDNDEEPTEQYVLVEHDGDDEGDLGGEESEQFVAVDEGDNDFETDIARQMATVQHIPNDNDMDLDEEQQVDTDSPMLLSHAPAAPQAAVLPIGVESRLSSSGRGDGPRVQAGSSSHMATEPGSSRQGSSTTAPPVSLMGNTAASGSTGKTVTVPAVDEKAQSELRRKIMDIQADSTISFADKAGMIQKLMSLKWQGSQRASDNQNDGSIEATEDDLKKTYHNESKDYLGCKHYRRGCKLKANCCGKWFNCRFCHDDVSDHSIVRSETKMMLCMHCKTIQEAAQSCSSCNNRMAVYYCDVCKLWNDDPSKNIYHCDDCGICRIGKGLGRDYFHCKKCNVCMNIQLQDNHKCIERNLECDCPICGEYMFTSTSVVIFMPCGHCIHSTCHEDYIKTSYQCPTCWKALGDMSAYYSKIDSLLAEQTMPPEYANIFSIVLCNDCEVKSEAPYHFLYHKCDKCHGYNTKVLETFKRVSDGQVQVVENATAAGAAGTAPENNISGSSNSLSGGSSSSPSSAMGGAGSSSSAIGSGTSSSATSGLTGAGSIRAGTGGGTTLVSLASVAAPRSPLMDHNASDDMSMAGISDNSAP